MHRKTFLKGLAGAAALAVAGLPAFAQDTIKIGEINHYKRMAAFAEPYKMGIELALEEVNAAGGVLGKPLEFIFRDDQGDPGEAIKIAEELMTRDGAVMLTGTILSNVGLAISSLAAEKKYLYLASEPLADSIVWASGNDYTFRLRTSTYMQAAMLAEEAAKSDAVRYATNAPNYAYGKEAVAAFTSSGTPSPCLRHARQPRTAQARMPGSSSASLSVSRGSRSGSGMVIVNGTSRMRRQMPWSLP